MADVKTLKIAPPLQTNRRGRRPGNTRRYFRPIPEDAVLLLQDRVPPQQDGSQVQLQARNPDQILPKVSNKYTSQQQQPQNPSRLSALFLAMQRYRTRKQLQ
eukprot:TRINITY_DN42712_c0_g1_i1.p1 TRINITY_DN42712_c0_g1~~TRINITY_DN42712_c0_g1_i1.p1  ORF type:complete len:102 (+),score=11.12 TRINITY_DN42712_c0_g1_i1:44-349(+)